jgi:hypothetical protein
VSVAILIIGALLVAAIAIVAIGRVVERLAVQAPTRVFDEDEAVEWIADRLPVEIASVLTHDDVRRFVLWHVAFLEDRGVATETAYAELGASGDDEVVVDEDDALGYVLGQAGAAGLQVDDAVVAAVIDLDVDYLEAIGAIGPRA